MSYSTYTPGDIIYVTRNRSPKGKCFIYQNTFRGNVDLSHHGSPLYEQFIVCVDPKTGEQKQFGDQEYNWHDAVGMISYLQEKLHKIKNIATY